MTRLKPKLPQYFHYKHDIINKLVGYETNTIKAYTLKRQCKDRSRREQQLLWGSFEVQNAGIFYENWNL